MQKKNIFYALCMAWGLAAATKADACTGITLKTTGGDTVVARTIDWSGSTMNSMYVITPRAYMQTALLPNNKSGGMQFASKYGFVGLAVEMPEFVIDGTNEAGLSAGLFYMPDFGSYAPFDPGYTANTISDLQLISWILSNFATIDEVKAGIQGMHIIHIDPRASTTHWRITQKDGRQVIMEIIDGQPIFYDSEIGVITNSPDYGWHIVNLDNYINLKSGTAKPRPLGALTLRSLSTGTNMLGLPGDMTSPSRFTRAAFFSAYARPYKKTYDTVMQAFHILNNFDVPLGIQFASNETPPDMPSATHWTVATDLTNGTIYYHTMYNRAIRRIDMNNINFAQVPFQAHPLDYSEKETIFDVQINTATGRTPNAQSMTDIANRVFVHKAP